MALVLALDAGMIDAALSLLEKPQDFETLASVVPPILATGALLLIAYLGLWFVLGRPLTRLASLEPVSAALSLALFLTAALTLALLSGLESATPPLVWFKVGLLLFLSSSVAVLAYWGWENARRNPVLESNGAALGLASPLLLFEMVVYEWVEIFAVDSAVSLASLLTSVAALAAAALTFGYFLRRRTRETAFRPVALFAALLAAAPFAFSGYARVSTPREPEAGGKLPAVKHVILISVDTLRADVLSGYNRDGFPTPAVDGLAEDGVLFEKAVAPSPWTLASLASILTGLSPSVHLVTEIKARLTDNVETLAERMKSAGYHTAAIVQNDLLRPQANFSQGYGAYHFLHEPSFGPSLGAQLLQWALPGSYPSPPWPSTAEHAAIARAWVERNRERPFFLWVHFYDPHAPYTPPEEYLPAEAPAGASAEFYEQKAVLEGLVVPSVEERFWIRTLYDAEVRYLDAELGRFLGTLKELGIYEDALIVFTSDHGEEFWEHGKHGHGHSQYNELLLVPLIVKFPGSSQRGRVTTTVSATSVTPTILDVSGIAYEKGRLSSPSLVPLLQGSAAGEPAVATAQVLFDRREAVFFDDLKYIESLLGGPAELFELASDPGETTSVATESPHEVTEARKHLSRYREASAALRKHYRIEESGEAEMDADSLRRLKALGYVQ